MGPWNLCARPMTLRGGQEQPIIFTNEEIEAQRQTGTCSRSHSHESVPEPGLDPRSGFGVAGKGGLVSSTTCPLNVQ